MTIRFGTVGAPSNTPQPGTDAAIRYSHDIGLNALEIAWVQSVRVKDETCQRIKETAIEHDVALSVHAPYYINLNSQTDELMQRSNERLLMAARKGFLAGATDIIFHPGSYHKMPAKRVYPVVRDQLAKLVVILQHEQVSVLLRPETMGKKAMFGSLDEIISLSCELDGVLPAIDIAHLHARSGTGSFNTYEEFAGMIETIQSQLGDEALKHMHFHLSGIEYGPRGEKKHLPLEESDLNWRAFLQVCIDYNVGGRIMTESPMFEADTLLVKRTYLEMIASGA